jgi:hypothetical protein
MQRDLRSKNRKKLVIIAMYNFQPFECPNFSFILRNPNLFRVFLFIFSLALTITPSLAMENSQLVDELEVEINQYGKIHVLGAKDVEIYVYIPQEDEFQEIKSIEIDKPYELVKDKYGNTQVKFVFSEEGEIDFHIKTNLLVKRRDFVKGEKALQEFYFPTSIANITPEIKELADKLTFGKSEFEKIASLVKWVHENIKYDLNYSNLNLSSSDVLRTKKSVCSGFSVLLISLLRSQGFAASYEVGYALGEEDSKKNFVAHGWVKVYTNNYALEIDPTWAEIPIDATHIKFASLPDSKFPEINVVAKGKSPQIKIEQQKVEIRIVKKKEKPIVFSKLRPLEKIIPKGYGVIELRLNTSKCVLTKLEVASCLIDGNELFEVVNAPRIVYFCKNKRVFILLKVKEFIKDKIVSCPITILPYLGTQTSTSIIVNPKEEIGKTKLFVEKDVLKPKEKFKVVAKDSHIFTIDGQYGFDNVTFFAHANDFFVFGLNKGSIDSKKIFVKKEKPLIAKIFAPSKAKVKKPLNFSVSVENKLNASQIILVKYKNITKQLTLKPYEKVNLTFIFLPFSHEDNWIQVFISAKNYSTSLFHTFSIEREEKLLDQIFSKIKTFLDKIERFLKELFSSII